MRFVAPGVRREAHHDRLGDDEPVRHAEVFRHTDRVDDKPAHHEFGLVQRAGGVTEAFRQSNPFGVPRAGRALEIADERVENEPGMLTQGFGGGEDQFAGDRVPFLRHRRGGAAPGDKRLGRLGELGRGHQHDVIGDLAETAAEQGQELHGLGDPVARDVPGDRRLAQPQFARQLDAGGEAFGPRAE